MNQEVNRDLNPKDEIDLVELFNAIWQKKRVIMIVTGVCFILGIVVAFLKPVEYEASCTLIAEGGSGSSSMGGLRDLAGLAGISMGSTQIENSSLPPSLYPSVVGSVPFLLELMMKPIIFGSMDSTVTSYEYFTDLEPDILTVIKSYTIGLPNRLFSRIENRIDSKRITSSSEEEPVNQNQILKIDGQQYAVIGILEDRIKVEPEGAIIKITVEMPDPKAAAYLTEEVYEMLTKEVTKYKIEKSKTNLEFIEERYKERKEVFEKLQTQLAVFSDRNKNITTSLAQAELQNIQNEYNLAFEIYRNLASQLEQAKIKMQDDTPIFTILEPIKVPLSKSSPNRKLIIIVVSFLGFAFATAYFLTKSLVKKWS